MTFQIRGRIEVSAWHPKPAALGRALAADAGVRSMLLGLAGEVVTDAQNNLNGLGSIPGAKVAYPSYRGKFWSAQPGAVAREVKVKDATKVFPLGAPGVSAAGETRVALVVSDHPYSWPYEFGALGIRSTAFLRKAVRNVAARHGGVKLRRYRRPAGAGGGP